MKKLMLAVGLLFLGTLIYAQKNYAVMLTDAITGNAITDASIKIRSTGKVIPVSESGNALVNASPADTLDIQAKGYGNREIVLALQSSAISVEMRTRPVPAKKTAAIKTKRKS